MQICVDMHVRAGRVHIQRGEKKVARPHFSLVLCLDAEKSVEFGHGI